MRVVTGGTFDILHDGHRALLGTAFALRPARVLIGLTTDRMAREARAKVNPYSIRERNLRTFLRAHGWRRSQIDAIDDPFGPADDVADLDAIVVSAERSTVAAALNEARSAKGLAPLTVHVVPMVLAQDGLPVASRRIRAGLIDRHGVRIKPVTVHVGTDNPVKVRAVRKVFERLRIRARVKAMPVTTKVPEQPFDEEAFQGAMNRANAAIGTGDFGVGIEAGLVRLPGAEDHLDVQYCVVIDRSGHATVGQGPGFAYPPAVLRRVRSGSSVGEAMAHLTGLKDIGSKQGAIGYLTQGRLNRDALTESAVLMAMVPRIRRDFYSR